MPPKTRDLAYAAVFTALIAAATVLTRFLPVAVVPYSLQTLLVFLAGGVLGRRTAPLSIMAYILLGLVGIPVFASPPYGGPAYFLVPTFGFLIGFIFTAWTVGFCLERWGNTLTAHVLSIVSGIAVMYLIALPYLFVILNFYLGQAVDVGYVIKIGLLPFIGLDVIKASVAAFISYHVRKNLNLS
ncbi:MAG: biotin transporter BioY [Syntrophomonadaceae bacterium]|jgi:biotin transport system substrate-specific component|nr:biotin transporter BioY [Syntrophomonadaceae bacterium]